MTESNFSFKNTIYFIFVGILVFSLLFLRSWHIVGPISARNLSAIILFIMAINKTHIVQISNNEKLYFVWLSLYIILCIVGDNLFAPEVYKNLIGYHMISVILIFSIPRIVDNYKILKWILIWFFIFYIFNCLITWLQYENNPIGWGVGNIISPINEEKYERIEGLEQYENVLSFSVCSGINGFVVTNGQFVAGFIPLASLCLWANKKKNIIIGILSMSLSVYIAFCIQQRMGLLISTFYILIVLLYRAKPGIKLMVFISLIYVIFFIPDILNFDADSMGRLLSKEDNIRTRTYDYFVQFISNTGNFVIGNPVPPMEHDPVTLAMSHNSILDSLRRAGIGGLLIFIVLLFSLLKECYVYFRKSLMNHDNYTIVFSISCFFFLLYSLTHSSGIPSGDVFTWLSYTLMLKCSNLYDQKQNIE